MEQHIPETLNHLYNLATGVWPVGVVMASCLKHTVPAVFSSGVDRGWSLSRERWSERRNEHLERALLSSWRDTLENLSESHAATKSEKDTWRRLKRSGEGWLKPDAPVFPSEITNAALFEVPGGPGWQTGWGSFLNADPPVLDGETLALFQQHCEAIEQQLQKRFGELLKQPRHREALIAFEREMLREILHQLKQDRAIPSNVIETLNAIAAVPEFIGQFSDTVLNAMTLQNEQQAEQLRENLQLLSKIALAVDSLRREMEGHYIIEGGGSLVCDLLANCEPVRARMQSRPLAGRETDLENLSAAAGDRCYVALSGPSGTGKSALLAHWIEELKQDSVRVCYHFFSREDDTARLGGGMACIVEQLLVAHRIRGRVQERDIDRLKAATRLLLEIPHEDPLVVVLDGLDEAFDESKPDAFALGRGWFPDELGKNVSVVFGVRYGPGLENAQDLGQQLRITNLKDQQLLNIDEAAIRALLPDGAKDVSKQIRIRTQGLAIYVIRVVEEIKGDIEGRQKLVRRLPAVFTKYVEDSLGAAATSKREWLDPLGFLALASAPLTSDELLRLSSDSDPRFSSHDLRNPPQGIGRWLLFRKESDLWSFDHDATRDAWNENLSDGETETLRRRLFDDCSRWTQHLGPYSLRFYVSDLLALSEGNFEKRNESIFALARDPEYWAAQRDGFPEQPGLPLQSARAGIRLATREENIPVLAELMFAHARAVTLLREETPLDAARRGAFERAIWLARQHDPERAAFGLLLVAWHEILADRSDRIDRIIDELEELPPFTFSILNECVLAIFRFAGKPLTADKRFLDVLRDHCSAEQLTEIATVQATAGESEDALTAANRITYDWAKVEALVAIAEAQATTDDPEDALTAANRITDDDLKAHTLVAIAKAQATAGDREGALTTLTEAHTTANRITWDWAKVKALVAIAKAQATAGDREDARTTLTEALTTANRITDHWSKAEALVAIAKAQATAGDREDALTTLTEALTTANRITDHWSKTRALVTIAEAQATAGDREDVLTTLTEALTTVNLTPDNEFKALELASIARAQATAGDRERALSTANRITDNQVKAWALASIATVQATAGDREGALSTANRLPDDWLRARTLADIATVQVTAGDREGALTTWNAALTTANRINDDESKARALASIATAQATASYRDAALSTLDGALSTEKRTSNDELKARTLADIAAVQATAGDREGALTTLNEALTTANRITDDNSKAWTLAGIATAQATAGDGEGALSTTNRFASDLLTTMTLQGIATIQAMSGDREGALTTVNLFTSDEWKARTLADIATAQAMAGDREGALTTLAESLSITNRITHDGPKGRALARIATAQATVGDREGALSTANQITLDEFRARTMADIATDRVKARDPKVALKRLGLAHRMVPGLDESRPASLMERLAVTFPDIGPAQSEDFLLSSASSVRGVISACSALAEVDPGSAEFIAGLVVASS